MQRIKTAATRVKLQSLVQQYTYVTARNFEHYLKASGQEGIWRSIELYDRHQEHHGVFLAKPLQEVSIEHGARKEITTAEGKLLIHFQS